MDFFCLDSARMGFLNFTNCTLFAFSMYICFTGKGFYDIFFPPTCQSTGAKSSDCIYSIPKWQNEFTVIINFIEMDFIGK